MAGGLNPGDQLPGVQALTQGRCEALGQPGVALGPGQYALVTLGQVADTKAATAATASAFPCLRCVKAMAAGEVMQTRPSRHGSAACAVIVAAAVIEVPTQVRIAQALLVQPFIKSYSI